LCSFSFLIKYLQLRVNLILLTKIKVEDQQTVKSKFVSPLCSKDYK